MVGFSFYLIRQERLVAATTHNQQLFWIAKLFYDYSTRYL